MNSLIEIVIALERSLRAADLPHAFGGAIALAYFIEEPRGTRDVNLNIFAPAAEMGSVLAALPAEVTYSDADLELLKRDGQARLHWLGDVPVDIFLATHEFHDEAALHTLTVPLAGIEIPILDSTALTVFKAFFNRTKDWADIEAMATFGSVDRERVVGWMDRLLGPNDERTRRLADTLESFSRATPEASSIFDPPSWS